MSKIRYEAHQNQNGSWDIKQLNDRDSVTVTIGTIRGEYHARNIVKLLNRQLGITNGG